jgi:GNAT superfamily N-acetyltransferase
VSFEIRPATQDERDRFVRSTWRRSFGVARRHAGRDYIDIRGGRRIAMDWWLAMHAKAIADEEFIGDTFVAAVGDECLGWVSFQHDHVQYVYVAPRFRRKGIGLALLRFALDRGADGPPAHLTYEGEQLLAANIRQQARVNLHTPAEAEAHDG